MRAGGIGGEKASPEPGERKRGAGLGYTCPDERGRLHVRHVPKGDLTVFTGGAACRQREESERAALRERHTHLYPAGLLS